MDIAGSLRGPDNPTILGYSTACCIMRKSSRARTNVPVKVHLHHMSSPMSFRSPERQLTCLYKETPGARFNDPSIRDEGDNRTEDENRSKLAGCNYRTQRDLS